MRTLVRFLLFIVLPLVEIYVIIKVGEAIGVWPTILLLILESAVGAWIVKREGLRAWRALMTAVRAGSLPGRELADAAVVLVGGVLLITPGFVTDVIGFFFLAPPTRPLARRGLTSYVTRHVVVAGQGRYARTRDGVHRIYDDEP